MIVAGRLQLPNRVIFEIVSQREMGHLCSPHWVQEGWYRVAVVVRRIGSKSMCGRADSMADSRMARLAVEGYGYRYGFVVCFVGSASLGR